MSNKNNLKTFYAISFAWQLGFFIVIPIIISLFLGLWLDKYLNTEPWLLIVGILLGITTSIYGVYHLISPLIKDKKND